MKQPGDSYTYDDGAAPTCAVDGAVSAPVPLDGIRGRLTCKAPLAPMSGSRPAARPIGCSNRLIWLICGPLSNGSAGKSRWWRWVLAPT